MRKTIFYLLCLVLALQSCTIQKRHYLPGYHIEWNKRAKISSPATEAPGMRQNEVAQEHNAYSSLNENKTGEITLAEVSDMDAIGIQEGMDGDRVVHGTTTGEVRGNHGTTLNFSPERAWKALVSLNNSKPKQPAAAGKQPVQEKKSPQDTCDLVIRMNGDEVSAKVTRITPSVIEYKRCDNPNGPVYVEKRSDVFMIKYKTGAKEVFYNAKRVEEEDGTQLRRHNAFSILSLILTLFSIVFALVATEIFVITLILGFLSGLTGLIQFNRNPGKFLPGSKIMSIISMSVCGLIAVLLLGTLVLDIL